VTSSFAAFAASAAGLAGLIVMPFLAQPTQPCKALAQGPSCLDFITFGNFWQSLAIDFLDS
jgi:hypothetical protein